MTKKDYEMIANVFNKYDHSDRHSDDMWVCAHASGIVDTIYAIAEMLEAENPRFDRARFLRACGLES